MLAVKLEDDHSTVVRCTGDAATMVVSTVFDYACTEGNVKLIVGDTDFRIRYFWKRLAGETAITSEAKKKRRAIWRDIGNIGECIGNVKIYLTLVSAFGRCNKISAEHGQGKLSTLILLEKY